MNNVSKFLRKMHLLKSGLCVCVFLGSATLQAQVEAQPRAVQSESLVVVQGQITDAATGRPIIGARLQMVGQLYAAMTDEKGAYSMRVPARDVVVEVTAENYATREIGLRNSDKVDIQLYSTTFTGLYDKVQSLTGEKSAVSMISPYAQIDGSSNNGAVSVDQNIVAELGAHVRGITRSSAPGNGANFFIRGLNSINAQASPLIIVDGVPFDNQNDRFSVISGLFNNPISSIDLNDIDKVTVLKDGTSLYGSRGANGAILITTKRGYSQATKIEVNTFTGMQARPRLPKMMNSDQFRVYASKMVLDDPHYTDYDNVAWLKHVDLIPKADGTGYTNMQQYRTFTNNTDWNDEVYQTPITQSYGISVNGGDEVALYHLAVGYTSAPSVYKNSSFSRLNARFNSDIQMYSRLKMAVDISYTQTDRDAPSDGIPADFTADPITSLGFLALAKSPFLAPYQYTRDGYTSPRYSEADAFRLANPTALIDENINKYRNESNHINIAATPRLTLMDGLELSSKFSYTLDKTVAAYFRPATGTPRFDRGAGNNVARNTAKTFSGQQISLFSDTRLNWTKDLGYQQSLDALLGYRYSYDQYKADWARADNTPNDRIPTISDRMHNRIADGVDDQVKAAAIYANVDYNWMNRYFLSGALSFDTSSKFGSNVSGAMHIGDYSWGLFPSLQAAWVLSNESFMQPLDVVSYARLRTGYSLTGNDQILSFGRYTYFAPFEFYNQVSGLKLAQIGNETLGWEKNNKFNIGLDVALFNDILTLSVDGYYNRVTDLLTQTKMPDVSGLDSYYWDNNGTLANTGMEFSFNVKAINTRDWKWELGAAISKYTNEVKSLKGGKSLISDYYGAQILTQEGSPVGMFYGYETHKRDGKTYVFANATEAHNVDGSGGRLAIQDSRGVNTYFEAGDVFFVDQNGDGIINEDDRVAIGNPNPDFVGNVTSRLKWKNFTLNALFTYSVGNDAYNYMRRTLESGSNYYNQTLAMNTAWTAEGQVTAMPRVAFDDPMGNSRFSDRWIEDASYFRLKSLNLSYDIPLNSSYIQGLTVWASGNNLWTVTKYLGSDPEFSNSAATLYQGVDAGLLAPGRSYYLGVKINL